MEESRLSSREKQLKELEKIYEETNKILAEHELSEENTNDEIIK